MMQCQNRKKRQRGNRKTRQKIGESPRDEN